MQVCDMCEKKMFRCKNKINIEINNTTKYWYETKSIELNFCSNCIEKVTKIIFKYIENNKGE